MSDAPGAGGEGQHALCAICQTAIAPGEETAKCPECGTAYHADCWADNHGCAVYGCPKVPPTEGRSEVEIAASYWGQEHKKCPSCGAQIIASAVRCRNCGATFGSARPEDEAEFEAQERLRARTPALKRGAILFFAFSALTCTAPLAALAGLCWYAANRKALKTLPALYAALCVAGIIVGFVQTAVIVAMSIVYQLKG
ncbi:MAG: hypothetical protein JXR37_21620 [Kiritimatiellae bacterium]|nr:hypothetical protein [Kiritimatiellia bacterium]